MAEVRRAFPYCSGSEVYLDNASTTQKPRAVIDAVTRAMAETSGNVHRGVHRLSVEATQAFESARSEVARFIGAAQPAHVVFTRGTTESINLVAQAWGRQNIRDGDEIVVTELEHHANLVPWQMLCAHTGAKLRWLPLGDDGALDLSSLDDVIGPRARLVAVSQVSNALGTVTPLSPIVARAREVGARVLVDGAQAAPHVVVDVAALGCDFYAFSGHKVYGPTGVGVLWGNEDALRETPPWQGGGEMISEVRMDGFEPAPLPARLEAGTPNISGAIGLGAALRFVSAVGRSAIAAHEADLLTRSIGALSRLSRVRVLGAGPQRAAVVSFVVDGVHAHDVGSIADEAGVALRAGHHCAEPIMRRYRLAATVRASFGMYNTHEDVDRMVAAVRTAVQVLG